MKTPVLGVALLLAAVTAAKAEAPPPGAESVAGAYFVCDSGQNAFTVFYDSAKAQKATIVTSNKTHYDLQRAPVDKGYLFKGQNGVEFWTDGQGVRMSGLKYPYQGCVRKN